MRTTNINSPELLQLHVFPAKPFWEMFSKTDAGCCFQWLLVLEVYL